MIRVPGLTDHGPRTDKLAEFVDLFPTLVEAAGLPELPLCPEHESGQVQVCTEGSSLMALIKNPKTPDWKPAAFSQFPRPDPMYNVTMNWTSMAYSMRTDRYR